MKTLLSAAVALFIHASAFAEPAAVAKETRVWRATHEREILTEFVELLSIPNLASDAPNIQRNADAIRAMCEKRGLTTKLLALEGAPPLVVANLSDKCKTHDCVLCALRRPAGRRGAVEKRTVDAGHA